MSGLGRIMNDSWICRKGCYHEISIKTNCECECHNSAHNMLKIRHYENTHNNVTLLQDGNA